MVESSFMVSASVDLTMNCLLIAYDNGREYTIDSNFIENKMGVKNVNYIDEVELGMNGAELILHTKIGTLIFPWDFILCYFEPEYEYFSG